MTDPPSLSPAQPKVLVRLRHAIRSAHYSPRTEAAYVAWVRRFIRFHGLRHPLELAEAEVSQYLTDLATRRKVSASTQQQALSALLLFYREVLHRPLGYLGLVRRATAPTRLPVVLTRGEVHRVLEELDGTYRLVGMLLYGAGLRLLEAVTLRVQDVDFARGEITVRRGKGAKDRVTVFPERLRGALAAHLETVKLLHEGDLSAGAGSVVLPEALGRKCPNAAEGVELAVGLSHSEALPGADHGRGAAAPLAPECDAAGHGSGGAGGGAQQAGQLSHVATFLRDPPLGIRL